jgi:hypothetical protein
MMKMRVLVLLSGLLWLWPVIGVAGEARRPNTPPPHGCGAPCRVARSLTPSPDLVTLALLVLIG